MLDSSFIVPELSWGWRQFSILGIFGVKCRAAVPVWVLLAACSRKITKCGSNVKGLRHRS